MLCRLNFDYDHALQLINDRRPRVEFNRYRCDGCPDRGRDALEVLRGASQLWLALVGRYQEDAPPQGVPPQAPAAASTDVQGVPPQGVPPVYNPWQNYVVKAAYKAAPKPSTNNKVAAIV